MNATDLPRGEGLKGPYVMRWFSLTLLFLLAVFPFTGQGARAGDRAGVITLVADEWPPFNHLPDALGEGYMVDIAREIFEREGYEIRYVSLPWKRAIVEAEAGNYTGIVGVTKRDEDGFIFPEEELALDRASYWVRRESAWNYKGLESLSGVCLGAIEAYDYLGVLNEYIAANARNEKRVQLTSGETALE